MFSRADERRVRGATDTAASYLASNQDADGYWRDYELPPGRSDAWTTAYVALAMLPAAQGQSKWDTELRRAAAVLLNNRRPEGWGYNGRTACDADSTSLAFCFLAGLDLLTGIPVAGTLSRYATSDFRICTSAGDDRFGSWATPHDEVAPVAGVALIAAGEYEYAQRIRGAILRTWQTPGWQSFWWDGKDYVRAQSLEFLAVSGGIPDNVAATERRLIAAAPLPTFAFQIANRLSAALSLGCGPLADAFAQELLSRQAADGGWPGSPVLLLRDQREPLRYEIYADDRRLVTTAVALAALTKWLYATHGV